MGLGLPGIYVEVRGDFSDVERDIKAAKAIIKEQATGISNALNNALSPTQVNRNISSMVTNLGTLKRASTVTGDTFDKLSVDLGDLSKNTGLTERQLSSLQSRLIKTQAAKAQERSLRNLARSAGLTKKEVRELGRQYGLTKTQIRNATGTMNRNKASMGMMLGSVTAVTGGVIGLVTAFGYLLKTGFTVAMKMDTFERSMVAISDSSIIMRNELKSLRQTADDTGQNFYKLTDSYRQLSAATKGTALTTADTRRVFKSVTEAAAVLGLSSHRTGLAIEALSQMASKGKVSMEELRRQLGDHIPGAMGIAARSMGVPIKEMFRMVEAGELMASDLLPRLADELHNMYGEAAQTAALESGQAAVNRLSQEWTDFKLNITEYELIVSSINAITVAIGWLSEKAELRSVWGTFREGARLASKGLLDFKEFSKATFEERQEMVDGLTRTEKVAADHFVANWQAAEKQSLSDYNAYVIKKEEIQASADIKGYERLQKYIETSQQQLKREYDNVVKYAKTEEERVAATLKYNKAIDQLATRTENAALKAQYAGDEYASFTQELFLMRDAGVNAGSQLALIEQNFDDLGKAGEEWEKKNAKAVEKVSKDLADVAGETGDNWGDLYEKIISGTDVVTESVSSSFGDLVGGLIAYNEDWEDSWDATWKSSVNIFASALSEMAIEAAASEIWDMGVDWYLSDNDVFVGEESGDNKNWLETGWSAVKNLFSFSTGGYTGSGGPNEPAGIVHRGEYVFSAEQVNALGLGTLQGLAKMPGFGNGGSVGGGTVAAPLWLNESRGDRDVTENTKETKENTAVLTEVKDVSQVNIDTMAGTIVSSEALSDTNVANTDATADLSTSMSDLGFSLSELGRSFVEGVATAVGGLIGVAVGSVAGPIGAAAGGAYGKKTGSNIGDEISDYFFGEDDWGELSEGQRKGIDDALADAFDDLDKEAYGEGGGSSSGAGTGHSDTEGTSGRYALGGIVNSLRVPNGDDGWAALSFGEGVVSQRGMAALARINNGEIGGNNAEMTRRLDRIIALLANEKASLVVDGQAFPGWIRRATSNLIAKREGQGASGRIYA